MTATTLPPDAPRVRPVPLYSIRPDAVLIHPNLPGFPITNPPTVVAALGSPSADFMVAVSLPPVDWHGVLSWYGIRQPRRAHIWSVRALLHLYLLLVARNDIFIGATDSGASYSRIKNHPELRYQALLDEGDHYVGNFWDRAPELIFLALHSAKENHVITILRTLFSVAQRTDAAHDCQAVEAWVDQLKLTRMFIQEAAVKNTLSANLHITRRRAGIIERALSTTILLARPNTVLPVSNPIPMTTDAKHIAMHKNNLGSTLSTSMDVLLKPYNPPATQPNTLQATHATPNPLDTPTAPTNPSTEHTHD